MSLRPFHKLPGSSSLTGGPVIANGASAATVIKYNLAGAVSPAVTDDSASGYSVGSIWIDTVANTAFLCADAAVGAAVWRQASSGSSSQAIGYTATVLTNSNVSLVPGTSKNNQAFSGTLSGAVIINASRTNAIEGDEFFLILNGPVISPANTLTIRENGAGSLIVWNGTETLNGMVILVYTGTAWVIKSSNVVSS